MLPIIQGAEINSPGGMMVYGMSAASTKTISLRGKNWDTRQIRQIQGM
jgi:hypothetical protein